jgi:phosphate-selective porin
MNVKLRGLIATAFASTCLMGFAGNVLADSTSDLVQALVSKGVLTEEEGALLTRGRADEMDVQKKKEKKHWSNNLSLRGYVQVRNTSMLGGDEGVNLYSDRSVGDDRSLGSDKKSFLIRRARVVLSGNVGDHLGIYVQPDFASSATGANNVAQLRDFYGDLFIDKTRVHRLRVGQSKVPFGFENLQSSQNRLALDRADALNSAVKDERDLGVFYYYTPEKTQAMFDEIMKAGLKHSGNYGQFAFGAYNGQGANRDEANDNYHLVSRFTYPWKTKSGQFFEMGIQGYHGQYVPTTGRYNNRGGSVASSAANLSSSGVNPNTAITSVTTGNSNSTAIPFLEGGASGKYRNGFTDERVAVSFMMYPQPFGLQGEWNWGKTPGLDIAQNRIEEKSLNGGYLQAMYKIDNFNFLDTTGTLIPFVKWQYFDGFNKAETNAPQNKVNDWEIGAEWQLAPEVELVAYYHHMKRNNLVTGNTAGRKDYESFDADALRVQLQYNF